MCRFKIIPGPIFRHASRTPSPVVVIVDPFCVGELIVQELLSRGFPIIGIKSSLQLPTNLVEQYDETKFVRTITHENIETTLWELRQFHVVAVAAGWDTGSELADKLQTALGVAGNVPASRRFRHSKYDMQEQLKDKGLRSIRQIASSSASDFLQQKECTLPEWPIVIKPAVLSKRSTPARNDQRAFVCWNAADVKTAFRKIGGKAEAGVRRTMLCQEFLDGTEYIINMMSSGGEHLVLSIWMRTKVQDRGVNNCRTKYSIMLPSEGSVQDKLRSYVNSILDALGVENGPSHCKNSQFSCSCTYPQCYRLRRS